MEADSENPDTLSYVREIARPFAERSGLTFHELQRVRRDGSIETIYGEITRTDNRSIGIPVYMSSGAPGNRSCTLDFKIAVCDRWLKAQGVRAVLNDERRIVKHFARQSKTDGRSCSPAEVLTLARQPCPFYSVYEFLLDTCTQESLVGRNT